MKDNELTIVLRARDLATRTIKTVGRSIQVFARTSVASLGALRRTLFNLRNLLVGGIGGAAIVKSFADFEAGIVNIQNLTDDTSFTFERLSKEIKRTALETGQSLDTLLSAGFTAVSSVGTQGLDVFDDAARLAVAGATTVDVAVKGLTRTMNNFGLSVEDAADTLFNVQRFGDTDLGAVAANFQKVLGDARAAEIGINDVSAAFSLLTRTFSAEETATNFNALLRGFTNATPQAKEFAATLGVDLSAAAIKAAGGLTAYIENLARMNLSFDQVTKLGGGSAEVLRGLRIVLQDDAKALRELFTNMTSGAGSAAKAFRAMADTLKNRLERLRAAFSIASVEIGESLKPVIEDLTDRLQRLAEWARRNRDVIARFGEVVLVSLSVAFEISAKKVLQFIDLVDAAFRNNDVLGTIGNFAETAIRIFGRTIEKGLPLIAKAGVSVGVAFGTAVAEAVLGTTKEQVIRGLADDALTSKFLTFLGIDTETMRKQLNLLTRDLDAVKGGLLSTLGEVQAGQGGNLLGGIDASNLQRASDLLKEVSSGLLETDVIAAASAANFAGELDLIGKEVAKLGTLYAQGADPAVIGEFAQRIAQNVEEQFAKAQPAVQAALQGLFGGKGEEAIFREVRQKAEFDLKQEIGAFGSAVPGIVAEELDAAVGRAGPGTRGALERLFDFGDAEEGLSRIRDAVSRLGDAWRVSRFREQTRDALLALKEGIVQSLPFLGTLEDGFEAARKKALAFAAAIRSAFVPKGGQGGSPEEETKKTTAALLEWEDAVQQVGPVTSAGLADMWANIASGAQSAKDAIRDFVTSALDQLSRLFLNVAFEQLLGGIFPDIFPQRGVTNANGNVLSGGFQAFANGSPNISRPTLGLVGEGRYNEAVIPLPDGRRVPVDMRGGGGGGRTVNLNITIQAVDGRSVALFFRDNIGALKSAIAQGLSDDAGFRTTVGRA